MGDRSGADGEGRVAAEVADVESTTISDHARPQSTDFGSRVVHNK